MASIRSARWHEPYYWGNGMPKTVEIRMSRFAPKVNTDWGTGFPDVFDKKFDASSNGLASIASCRAAAQRC